MCVVFLLSVFLFLAEPVCSSSVALEDSWVEKASMPTARAFLGVAVVDGKIYAIGGDSGADIGNLGNPFGRSNNVVNATEEYDPVSDTWVRRNPMPTARAGLAVAVFQNEIYCIGGWTQDSSSTGINEVYNPATDSWTTKTSMPVANARLVANVVNGKIYVLPIFSTSDFEVYDPQTDSWSSKTPPPTEVTGFGSAVIGEKIYFEGAQPRNETLASQHGTIQIYDTSTDNWTVSSTHATQYDLYGSGGKTTGELAPERIYFFMANITNAYDISSDTWLTGASMPATNFTGWLFGPTQTARYCAAAVAVNDKFYVIGGRAGVWGYFVDMHAVNSNAQYYPIGYGTVQPTITPSSPAASSIVPVVGVGVASAVAVGVGLTYYLRKRG